jgi:putative phosphoesterase
MKIGIISDTHDDLDNVRKAIEIFKENKVSLIVHAGDFIFPGVVDEFKKLKDELPTIEISGVLGNNDGEKLVLLKKFSEMSSELKTEFDDRLIGSLRFGIYHGTSKELTEAAIQSSIYDVFIHGHTHKRRNEIVQIVGKKSKKTHVLNPGTAHRSFPNIDRNIEEKSSVIIYDIKDKSCQFIDLSTGSPLEEPLLISTYER